MTLHFVSKIICLPTEAKLKVYHKDMSKQRVSNAQVVQCCISASILKIALILAMRIDIDYVFIYSNYAWKESVRTFLLDSQGAPRNWMAYLPKRLLELVFWSISFWDFTRGRPTNGFRVQGKQWQPEKTRLCWWVCKSFRKQKRSKNQSIKQRRQVAEGRDITSSPLWIIRDCAGSHQRVGRRSKGYLEPLFFIPSNPALNLRFVVVNEYYEFFAWKMCGFSIPINGKFR